MNTKHFYEAPTTDLYSIAIKRVMCVSQFTTPSDSIENFTEQDFDWQ